MKSNQVVPKISVVTPNLNGDKTLRQTIQSILEQDYPNLEYIIVDGGSTDDSNQIIAEYRDDINTIIVGQDRTLYDGVAKGFDVATGEIFAWLNSDDMYEPGLLNRVGTIFAQHPDWSVIYFDGTVWKQGWRVPNRPQKKYIGYPELLLGHILYQDSVFFRRSAYESVGGLDRENLRLAGDYQLWLKLAAKYRFHYVSGPGSCFRIRPNQLSLSDWGAYMKEMAAVRKGAWPSLPRFFWLRSISGVLFRRILSELHIRGRSFSYPLRHENKNWSLVNEAVPQPLRNCRCPICHQSPERLLFSTPDTCFGDRTVHQVYFCADCEVAFLFPKPTQEEMDTLYEYVSSDNRGSVGDPLPDTYSPYRVNSFLKSFGRFQVFGSIFYLVNRVARLVKRNGFADNDDDIVPVQEAKEAPIFEIGCSEGQVLDTLRNWGYRNLYGSDKNSKACRIAAKKGHQIYVGDLTETDWPGLKMEAIMLNQFIEHVDDPVKFLIDLRERLVEGGRIYLATPNLNSAWVKYYGPCWAHWHFPYHVLITGSRGIRKIAQQAGYGVKWLKTRTPGKWLYLSESLGIKGLGGYVSHYAEPQEQRVWFRAAGATVYSRLFYDWRQRGDCLYACLVKQQ